MKIYFLRQFKTPFGGAENYLLRLTEELTKQNIEFDIIHSLMPKFMIAWLRALFFNVQVCITKKEKFYFSLERITCSDVYRAGDGVHKIFMHTKKKHSSFRLLDYTYCFLEKRCFQKTKHIIANSNMVKQEIIDTYHISPNKISVIYNGINLPSPFDKNAYKVKLANSFNLKSDIPILLFVGSGFERKGVQDLLLHLSKLQVPFHAFIVGKEKKISIYQKLSQDLGLDKKVLFTGPRKDVDIFYKGSDVFLFPTHYEPFSNVILEAMSYSNAVFTTSKNGASEILDPYFVLDGPSDETIVEKLETLLTNQKLLSQIQQTSFKKAKQFSIEKNVQKTLEVIHEYLH